MNRARLVALAGLTLASAQAAWGQSIVPPNPAWPVTVHVTSDNAPGDPTAPVPVSGGSAYSLSPFSGTVTTALGATTGVISLSCVDFFHDASAGTVFQANQVNLGDLIANEPLYDAFTRLGSNPYYTTGLFTIPSTGGSAAGTVVASVLTGYKAMAYLMSQEATLAFPSTDAIMTGAIQTAMWNIMGNYTSGLNYFDGVNGNPIGNPPLLNPWYGGLVAGPGSAGDATAGIHSTQYWINQALTVGQNETADFYKEYYIVTDINHSAPDAPDASKQEIMYHVASPTVTPEPASIALMATGLFAVGGMAMKRRRRA